MNKLDLALKSPLILTIHGWKTSGNYMRDYTPYAEARGFPIFHFNYGYIILKTLKNVGIVDRIVDFLHFYYDLTGQRCVIIGHSNGCELGWRVAKKTEFVIGLCFNNAALDSDAVFPSHLHFIHNWYTPGDIAVKLGSWLPWNTWGRLGARAYDGATTRVKNFNKGEDFKGYESKGHSDTYNKKHLKEFYLPLQIEHIESELSQTQFKR